MSEDRTCTAFQGERLLASGAPADVAAAVHAALQAGAAHVLIFDDETGEQLELDLRADPPAIAARSPGPKPGRGRPKLGVTPRKRARKSRTNAERLLPQMCNRATAPFPHAWVACQASECR